MKILIRLPNWLGDVVMSTAFIATVQQLYPEAAVDVIVKKELADVAGLIPGLNTIYLFSKNEFRGLKGAYRFGRQFAHNQYDLFFNLPTSFSSLVIGWASGAIKRIGFMNEGGFFMLTNAYKKPLNCHRVQEYANLLERFSGKNNSANGVELNVPVPEAINKNRVILNFNSEAVSRRMPHEKGLAIINQLTNVFSDTTFTFIGSPKESTFIEHIINEAENKNRIENLAGKTSLSVLVSLMASSAVVLTTDSGPAHLANSVGTPTVVLFGAGNEHNTAPYNKGNLTVIRYGKLSCEPCVKNTCKIYGVPKCMQLIEIPLIIDALSFYLAPDFNSNRALMH